MLFAFRTEQAHRQWAELYVKFLRQRDPELRCIYPRDADSEGVEAFPTHLVVRRRVAAFRRAPWSAAVLRTNLNESRESAAEREDPRRGGWTLPDRQPTCFRFTSGLGAGGL